MHDHGVFSLRLNPRGLRAACQVGAEVQHNKTILVSQVGAEVQQKKKKTILVRILRWLMKWMLEMGTRFIKAEKVEVVLLLMVQKFSK